MAVDLIRIENT